MAYKLLYRIRVTVRDIETAINEIKNIADNKFVCGNLMHKLGPDFCLLLRDSMVFGAEQIISILKNCTKERVDKEQK